MGRSLSRLKAAALNAMTSFGVTELSTPTHRLRVNRAGIINFPALGPVQVAGMTFSDVRDSLNQRVKEQMIGIGVTKEIEVIGYPTRPLRDDGVRFDLREVDGLYVGRLFSKSKRFNLVAELIKTSKKVMFCSLANTNAFSTVVLPIPLVG